METFRRVINTVEEDLTDSERRDYEVDLEKYIKTMGMIRTGRIEGREEGREDGRDGGRAEGRAERQMEIARAVKEQGLSVEVIAKCTGMAVKEIEQL